MLNDASSPYPCLFISAFFFTGWKSITSSAGNITSIFHRKSIIWEEKLLLCEKGRNYASLSTKKLPLPILNEFACDEPGTIGRHKLGYRHVIPLSKKNLNDSSVTRNANICVKFRKVAENMSVFHQRTVMNSIFQLQHRNLNSFSLILQLMLMLLCSRGI